MFSKLYFLICTSLIKLNSVNLSASLCISHFEVKLSLPPPLPQLSHPLPPTLPPRQTLVHSTLWKVWVLLRVEDTEFAKQLVYCILYCMVGHCFSLFIVLSFCVYCFANSVSSTQNKSRHSVFSLSDWQCSET